MIENEFFKLYKIEYNKLEPYGFIKEDNHYIYSTQIVDNDFRLIVEIDINGTIDTKVIDVFSDEEYILHRVKKAKGKYASKVKEAYEKVLNQIKDQCMTKEVFKHLNTKTAIEYVKEKYNDELEFLWGEDSLTAIFRRKDSNKWYGLIMAIPKNKLNHTSDEIIEAMNLKGYPNKTVDRIHYFPAYHMNKKYWYTVNLSSDLDLNELFENIDLSYRLVGKN